VSAKKSPKCYHPVTVTFSENLLHIDCCRGR